MAGVPVAAGADVPALALVVGEAVRPLLRWWLGRSDGATPDGVAGETSATPPLPATGGRAARAPGTGRMPAVAAQGGTETGTTHTGTHTGTTR